MIYSEWDKMTYGKAQRREGEIEQLAKSITVLKDSLCISQDEVFDMLEVEENDRQECRRYLLRQALESIAEEFNSPENDDVRCNLFSSLWSHQKRLQEEIQRGLQVYRDLIDAVKSGVITDIQDVADIQSDLLDFCDHAPGPAVDLFNEFANYVSEHFADELEIRSSFEKMLFHRNNRGSEE